MATLWQSGDNVVERASGDIRKISGCNGKGCRMKEIILELAEVPPVSKTSCWTSEWSGLDLAGR